MKPSSVPELSRRTFLAGLAAAPLAAPRPVVVDTHMHVWTNDTKQFPFAHPSGVKVNPPKTAGTAELLLEEMDRYKVDFSILVQVIYYGWDNRYVAQCLKQHPTRFRAHGLIDPTDPEVSKKLEYWVREHGFSGMRFSPIYYQGRDDWMTSEAHDRLWKKAQELGAIFNYFIAADQLAKLEVMLARHPGVKIVIDHLARVDLKKPDRDAEIAKLTRLAKYPNVWVKVSELSVISLTKDYPYNDTFPWVRRVYETFGADRLLYGTGFPGVTRAEAGRPSIEQELALFDHEIPFIPKADSVKIMGRNAAALWKLPS